MANPQNKNFLRTFRRAIINAAMPPLMAAFTQVSPLITKHNQEDIEQTMNQVTDAIEPSLDAMADNITDEEEAEDFLERLANLTMATFGAEELENIPPATPTFPEQTDTPASTDEEKTPLPPTTDINTFENESRPPAETSLDPKETFGAPIDQNQNEAAPAPSSSASQPTNTTPAESNEQTPIPNETPAAQADADEQAAGNVDETEQDAAIAEAEQSATGNQSEVPEVTKRPQSGILAGAPDAEEGQETPEAAPDQAYSPFLPDTEDEMFEDAGGPEDAKGPAAEAPEASQQPNKANVEGPAPQAQQAVSQVADQRQQSNIANRIAQNTEAKKQKKQQLEATEKEIMADKEALRSAKNKRLIAIIKLIGTIILSFELVGLIWLAKAIASVKLATNEIKKLEKKLEHPLKEIKILRKDMERLIQQGKALAQEQNNLRKQQATA